MRKQILLGTTALMVGAIVAPGFAAAEEMPLRLEVRGYQNDFFGIGDVTNSAGTDFGNTNIFNDGEIHFKGETKLDNGLTFGVQVELESFQSGDQIDEAYSYVSGEFGKVVIGSENLANYNTFWGVTAPSVGVPINSGWITVFTPAPGGFGDAGTFRTTLLTTNIDIGNDEAAISYYSPRFAGFQFTGGFAPAVANDGTSGGGDGQAGQANEGTQYHNAFGVGLNFSNEFNGVSLGAAVGYNQGSVDSARKALGVDDFQQVKAGASIGFAGFTVAGSYAREMVGRVSQAGTNSAKGEAYDVGASYSTGPWGVSATYFHGENEGLVGTAANDETQSFVGAVSYDVGPGITTSLSILYGKLEDEGGSDVESTVGIVGLAIKF
jgi:hypothetical protein